MQVTRVLRATGAVMAASLMFGTAAFADSTIVGTVLNAENKQPVADVVVTATSPNLQGEQVVVTDEKGEYRIPQLPPGTYTIRYEKESFKPFSRPDVTMRLDRTVRVNVLVLPEGVTETIDVVGRPPTIDVGSTATGVNVDQEFIKRIAVNRPGGKGGAARSFESLAELAPGAQNDTYGVSINGSTSPENGYIVDGLSTSDPAYGVNASPLSVEFVQDVNIITGGYMPEYGRSTGGIINAVTKSGANEFHGSVFGNWTPGVLEGVRTPVVSAASVVSGTNKLWNLGDVGVTLGGPILKDKLWFFVGAAPSLTRFRHERSFNSFRVTPDGAGGFDRVVNAQTGFDEVDAIPNSSQFYFADARSVQAMGKLTYLINSDHNVSLSLSTTPSVSGGAGRLSVSPQTGGIVARMASSPAVHTGSIERTNATSGALKYAGAFMDKQLLVDANLGWFHQNASDLPSDGSQIGTTEGLAGRSMVQYAVVRPLPMTQFESVPDAATYCGATVAEQTARCPVQNYLVGGPGFINESELDRVQVNAKVTYLLNALGKHVIKAGVDVENLTYAQLKAYTGGVFLSESQLSATTVGWIDSRRYGYQTSPDTAITDLTQRARTGSLTYGGFVQDSWSVANFVTLNVGVRYDVQAMYGGDGRLALLLANQVSPRVGVIVDPLANGQMKFYVNFARYYEQVPLDMMDRAFPGERRVTGRHYDANDPNRPVAPGNENVPACDPSTLEGQRACEDPRNAFRVAESSRNPNRLFTGGKVENEPVDPNIIPQSSDEFVVGAEYEVLANTRLGASYTHKNIGAVIEDMSRDDGNTYFLGNPGLGFAKEFPTPVRDYDAVTVFLNRAFADGWLAQASLTWSRLYGNYPGLFKPETLQLDPNILSDFDLISLLPNRTGLLPFDRTWSVKLFGAKEFAFTKDLVASLGLSYRGNSGTPINFYGAHPEYGEDEAFVLPRGTGGRTDWVNIIDSNLNLTYRLSKDSSVGLTVDVFNLFNFQTATSVDQSYTFSSVLPVVDGTRADLPTETSPGKVETTEGVILPLAEVNKNYGKATLYQAPRQFRFGIRYTF